jgi:hypothetical protein
MPRRNDIAKMLIIGSGPKRLLAFAVPFLIFMAFCAPARACVISPSQKIQVSPIFRVVVSHESTPIAGIQVEVYDEGELNRLQDGAEWRPVLTLVTSRDGTAEVKNLKKGLYLVETKGPGGGSAAYADVSDNSDKLSNQILLQWPYSWGEILKLTSLSGELVSNDPWTPFENIRVELWAAGLEKPLAVAQTGPQGRFSFNETRPGLYVLHIRGQQKKARGSQIEGSLPVELAPSAADALTSLALRLDETDCGIQYSRCTANTQPVSTGSRRLRVIYEPGTSEFPGVENAKYKLIDEHGASIAKGATDHEGFADLPSDFVGRATLVVASPLSTTAQQVLDLLPPDGRGSDLVVTMMPIVNGDNQCSVVTLEKNASPQ